MIFVFVQDWAFALEPTTVPTRLLLMEQTVETIEYMGFPDKQLSLAIIILDCKYLIITRVTITSMNTLLCEHTPHLYRKGISLRGPHINSNLAVNIDGSHGRENVDGHQIATAFHHNMRHGVDFSRGQTASQ
jgi:hypothetical protein